MALFALAAAHAQHFRGYDLIVPEASVPNEITVVDGTGVTLPGNRSFVIGIEGGVRNPIEFRNWEGTANYPIVITNRHGTGRVSITDEVPGNPSAPHRSGLVLVHCKYIQVRGDNDPAHRYGIEIARAGGKMGFSGRRGVDVTGRSTDVEISFLEIREASFAGIMVKQDPDCRAGYEWTLHPTLVYNNIKIHDNYVHDVGGECFYIGWTAWPSLQCSGTAYGHEIHGLKIYNNLVERGGWDGIQVGSARTGTEIYNNIIVDSGAIVTGDPGNTGVGVQLGSGTSGLFYNNWIINSRGNNIALFGVGDNYLFNNFLIGGGNGMFSDNRPNPPPGDPNARQTLPNAPYYFFNNTVVGPGGHGLWTMNDISDNYFQNNIIVVGSGFDHIRYENGANSGNESNNVEQNDYTGLGFVNAGAYDFRISGTSAARDTGTTIAAVTKDFHGIARPQGTACDAGASEAGALSTLLVATPPSSGSSNGAITASTIGGTAPYSYAWAHGPTTQTISSLGAGLYTVTVTDSAGAKVTESTYLFEGAEMGMPVTTPRPNEVHAPAMNPPSGTYTTTQSVALSTATPGATIRYTTNGTVPTPTSGTVYSSPISVSATGTIKAIAYKAGMIDSPVSVATYFIGAAPAAPELSIVSISDRRVHLSWTTSPTATRYELKVATTSGGPYTSLGVQTGTAFTHNGLTNGTTYYYVIDASNIYGASANSTQVTATPFPYPGTVGILSGFTAGPTSTSPSDPADGAFNAQPTWNSTTQRPEGDDPVPHSSTGTNHVNRFWAIDFTADFAKYNIVETWTRYRPSSIGDQPGFPVAWWDDDKDTTNDGTNEPDINFQTAQGLVSIGSQQWLRDRDFGVAPLTPQDRYLVLGTGPTPTWRANEFALIGWVDGTAAAPSIVQQPVSQTVPAGSSVSFTVGVTGSPRPTYQWRKNGVNISGATSPWLELNDVQSSDAASYSVVVTNASGSATSNNATLVLSGQSQSLTILTPVGAGTAVGSQYCGAIGAFDEQPTWDAVNSEPVGDASSPHSSTATAYANRHWYIDLGTNYANLRIVQMWTRYRPFSGGTHPGYAAMWWDDDNDNVNDGVNAPTLNFNTGASLSNIGSQIWWQDRDFGSSPVTPQGRYLVVSVGASPTDRPNEFVFVGYVVP